LKVAGQCPIAYKVEKLTMAMAVIDLVIHRFFSRRCPITIQAQRSTMNKVIAFTEASSGPASPILIRTEPKAKPMKPPQSQKGPRNSLFDKRFISMYVKSTYILFCNNNFMYISKHPMFKEIRPKLSDQGISIMTSSTNIKPY